MPSYELALMLRAMPKPELKTALKRVSHAIFNRGGIIRDIENLGFRAMPYKTSAHGLVHREANYFIFKIDTATQAVADLKEEYSRDVDIVRQRVYKTTTDSAHDCTLETELLPPAYRKEVQKMIEVGKTQVNRFTYKFKYNSGLDYYPFQSYLTYLPKYHWKDEVVKDLHTLQAENWEEIAQNRARWHQLVSEAKIHFGLLSQWSKSK